MPSTHRRSPLRALLLLLATSTFASAACHPGNEEARKLRVACDAGSADVRSLFV